MPDTKIISIPVSQEVYDRIQRISPKKEWGENHKSHFLLQIFLDGLECSSFLNREKRFLEHLLELNQVLLKPEDKGKADALEVVARQMLEIEDFAARQPQVASNGTGTGG